MKRITEKRWFGPKHVGWGPAPRSWEGWVVIVVWLASVIGTLYYLHTISSLNIVNIVIVIVVAAVILLSIAALTYGSDKEE
jgi:predicted membrane channel-forming protein YqfA (hemolysin III family)